VPRIDADLVMGLDLSSDRDDGVHGSGSHGIGVNARLSLQTGVATHATPQHLVFSPNSKLAAFRHVVLSPGYPTFGVFFHVDSVVGHRMLGLRARCMYDERSTAVDGNTAVSTEPTARYFSN